MGTSLLPCGLEELDHRTGKGFVVFVAAVVRAQRDWRRTTRIGDKTPRHRALRRSLTIVPRSPASRSRNSLFVLDGRIANAVAEDDWKSLRRLARQATGRDGHAREHASPLAGQRTRESAAVRVAHHEHTLV